MKLRRWWLRPSQLTPNEREVLINIAITGKIPDCYFIGDIVGIIDLVIKRGTALPQFKYILADTTNKNVNYSGWIFRPELIAMAAAVLEHDALHWGDSND